MNNVIHCVRYAYWSSTTETLFWYRVSYINKMSINLTLTTKQIFHTACHTTDLDIDTIYSTKWDINKRTKRNKTMQEVKYVWVKPFLYLLSENNSVIRKVYLKIWRFNWWRQIEIKYQRKAKGTNGLFKLITRKEVPNALTKNRKRRKDKQSKNPNKENWILRNMNSTKNPG